MHSVHSVHSNASSLNRLTLQAVLAALELLRDVSHAAQGRGTSSSSTETETVTDTTDLDVDRSALWTVRGLGAGARECLRALALGAHASDFVTDADDLV